MGRFAGVELDDVELSGERLVLRRWRPSDAQRVHEIMQDPSMSTFLEFLPQPYTPRDARDFVDHLGHERRGEGTGLGSAVVERTTGTVVGAASLRLSGDAYVGYWIAPEARGRRYAVEATQLLARFAHEHGVARVHLDCDITNLASIRTALRAGFPFEVVARGAGVDRDGSPKDVARFARVATDGYDAVEHSFAPLPAGGLSDGVLMLRTALPADAPAYAEIETDELALRWSFDGKAPSGAEIGRRCTRAGLDWLVGRQAQLVMVDVASGRVAGNCQLRRSPLPRLANVGYAVHPAFRGRGFTARALRLLAEWAFDVLGDVRLELGAKTGNVASQRAALAGGFEPDGVRRSRLPNADGSTSDEAWFARLRPPAR